MATISKPYSFSAGATIVAAEHNDNFDEIYQEFNGNITNSNISASAGIAYSKIDLTGNIVNGDISASAGIVASKLVLTSPGGIGTTTPAAGKFTTLEATSTFKLGTTHQGDVIYDNGTSLVRLTPGTSGQFLKTQGTAANPIWANATISVSGAATTSVLLSDSPGSNSTTETEYTKLKEITSFPFSGTVYVTYELRTEGGAGARAKVYVNGVDAGSAETSDVTAVFALKTSSAITVAPGDAIQIYGKTLDNAFAAHVQDVKVYGRFGVKAS